MITSNGYSIFKILKAFRIPTTPTVRTSLQLDEGIYEVMIVAWAPLRPAVGLSS
jgi:hypothetical protein